MEPQEILILPYMPILITTSRKMIPHQVLILSMARPMAKHLILTIREQGQKIYVCNYPLMPEMSERALLQYLPMILMLLHALKVRPGIWVLGVV